jgi:hypothetical protein
LIERQDSLQTEADLKTGFTARLKITWLTPCTYDLLGLGTNLRETMKHSFFKTNSIHIEIIAVGKNYYVHKSP